MNKRKRNYSDSEGSTCLEITPTIKRLKLQNEKSKFDQKSLENSQDETTTTKEITNLIEEIHQNSKQFEKKIKSFSGLKTSKEYFEIDEGLLKNIEKLDKIKIENDPELRRRRKVVIKHINQLLEDLDIKCTYSNDENKAKFKEEIINVINEIHRNSKELATEIEAFSGPTTSKEYFNFDESLLKNIEKLDAIDTKDDPDLKQRRKNVIKYINQLLQKLDDQSTI